MKRKLTYEEIIKKHKYFNIDLIKRYETIISNNMLDYIINNDRYNNKIMLDKQTQKDYVKQNYDYFPNMYNEIDAESKNILINNKLTQTKRYILKDFPTPYSSYPPSSKPPSTPPDYNIYKPTPPPSEEPSEAESDQGKGNRSLLRRYIDLFDVSPLPTPPRTPSEEIPIYNTPIKNTPSQSSSSSSSSSSSALTWTPRRIRERSRSRSN